MSASKFALRIFCLALLLPALSAQPDQAIEKSRRAKEAMASGRFQEAASIYRELVKAMPGDPNLIMNLGIALHMSGQDREAVKQLEAAAKLKPNLAPAWLFLGASYLRLGEPAQAVKPLERFLASQPNDKKARQMLADALLGLGRYEQAAEQFRKLAELEPEDPRAWYGLGRSYEALAVSAFQELEEVAPESPYLYALVASSQVKQKRYGSAFYLYRLALAKMPNMRGVHAALAEIYRNTGHPDWASVEEERERQIQPPDCKAQKLECEFLARRYLNVVREAKSQRTPQSYYWLSLAYNELALEAFSRLAALPPSRQLHEIKAEVYRNQGQHMEAVKEWREALKFSPHDDRIKRELAVTLYLSGNYQEAQAVVEELLEREPNSADLNFLRGDMLLNLQQVERAIPFLKNAIRYNPKLLEAHASLGRAYMQMEQAERAIPHLKAALEIDGDGSLHYQLARAYQIVGQQELAGQTLQKYKEIRNSIEAKRRELEEETQITPP